MTESIFTIEQLNLRLPPGFDKRADAIARDVARQLARLPVTHSCTVNTLTISGVKIASGETNQVIARRIAQGIHAQMKAHSQSGRASSPKDPINRQHDVQSKKGGV